MGARYYLAFRRPASRAGSGIMLAHPSRCPERIPMRIVLPATTALFLLFSAVPAEGQEPAPAPTPAPLPGVGDPEDDAPVEADEPPMPS